jgi:hypothetical protein
MLMTIETQDVFHTILDHIDLFYVPNKHGLTL